MVLREALASLSSLSEATAVCGITIQLEQDYEQWLTSYVIDNGEGKAIKIRVPPNAILLPLHSGYYLTLCTA